jgi:ribonuclease HI
MTSAVRTTERRGICPVDAYVCYTDGSATKVEGHIEASARWGLRILLDGDGRVDENATVRLEGYGPVVLDKAAPCYAGATELANNAAEITALVEVLHWLLYTDMETWRPVHLRTDSDIAIGWATGRMRAKRNKQLACTAHNLYRKVKAQREGKVTWAHVYSHTGYSMCRMRQWMF